MAGTSSALAWVPCALPALPSDAPLAVAVVEMAEEAAPGLEGVEEAAPGLEGVAFALPVPLPEAAG